MRRPSINSAGDFVRELVAETQRDRLTGLAAEVAFFGMLSVLPGIVALGAALTLVGKIGDGTTAAEIQTTMLGWLEGVLTDEATTITRSVRATLMRPNGDVFTIAFLVALWSGSRGIDAVVRAVVLVTNSVERRSWWRRRLLSFGLLAGTAVAGAIVLSMFVVGPLLGGGVALAANFGIDSAFVAAWRWARVPGAFAALTAWALVILHTSQPQPPGWRSDLPGALTAATLWVVSSFGLRFYLGSVGRGNVALGALGGPLIVLIWFYLLAAALLLGANVSQQLRRRADQTSLSLNRRGD